MVRTHTHVGFDVNDLIVWYHSILSFHFCCIFYCPQRRSSESRINSFSPEMIFSLWMCKDLCAKSNVVVLTFKTTRIRTTFLLLHKIDKRQSAVIIRNETKRLNERTMPINYATRIGMQTFVEINE